MKHTRVVHYNKLKERIIKSIADQIILTAINKQGPMHSYGVIRYIKKEFGVCLTSSALYPRMHKLEEAGLLTSEWILSSEHGKPSRLNYSLTPKGHKQVREDKMVVKDLIKSISRHQK